LSSVWRITRRSTQIGRHWQIGPHIKVTPGNRLHLQIRVESQIAAREPALIAAVSKS